MEELQTPSPSHPSIPPTAPVTDARPKNEHLYKTIMLSLGAILVLAAVFEAGVFVGYRKASYSLQWGSNYQRMFVGPPPVVSLPGGPGGPSYRHDVPGGPGYLDAHGIFGTVLKVDQDDLIIKDQDDVEKTIVVSTSTAIRERDHDLKLSQIPPDDTVVIIGAPDDEGQIDAKLIRVFTQN